MRLYRDTENLGIFAGTWWWKKEGRRVYLRSPRNKDWSVQRDAKKLELEHIPVASTLEFVLLTGEMP